MPDFSQLRNEMVETQLIPRGINDTSLLNAFRKVPRHEFVPENTRSSSYEDCALPLGDGQTISQPYMVAIMTELLKLKGHETILEVGTGSGYQAAILAELCHKVYTIEWIESLSKKAERILRKLGYVNLEFIIGDGSEGYPQAAPYDGIIVTAGCPDIPPPLVDQLSEGGRLIIPVGDRFLQTLTLIKKDKGKVTTDSSIGCVFVPLVGKFGWGQNQPLLPS